MPVHYHPPPPPPSGIMELRYNFKLDLGIQRTYPQNPEVKGLRSIFWLFGGFLRLNGRHWPGIVCSFLVLIREHCGTGWGGLSVAGVTGWM